MKKVLIGLLVICCIGMCGCAKDNVAIVKANLSEVTYTYFTGELGENRASISVGEREEPYIKDGFTRPKCSFALVVLRLGNEYGNLKLPVEITINGKSQAIEMELVNMAYMFDMECVLCEEDSIALSYFGKTLDFEVQHFDVDWQQAISFAAEWQQTQKYLQKGRALGEFYLKVLGRVDNNYDDFFWCFTIVGRNGEIENCVFSVDDGSIIASKR